MFKQIGGTTGSIFAGACCLGFTPLLAGLSAVGAGFLIRDAILVPMLVLFLGFTLWSLWGSRSKHHQQGPFYLGVFCAISAFAALWFFTPLAWAGLVGLVAASIWDIVILRRNSCVVDAAEVS